jgi:hypothetical protein
LIGWIIANFVIPKLGASFCSIFPLREIIEAPDFDATIKSAADKYLAKQPAMTIGVPGMQKWLNSQK